MTDYLRVKDNETKHEYSVTTDRYDSTPDLFTKVSKPATNSAGDPLEPKYHVEVTSIRQKAKGSDVAQVE